MRPSRVFCFWEKKTVNYPSKWMLIFAKTQTPLRILTCHCFCSWNEGSFFPDFLFLQPPSVACIQYLKRGEHTKLRGKNFALFLLQCIIYVGFLCDSTSPWAFSCHADVSLIKESSFRAGKLPEGAELKQEVEKTSGHW